MKCLDRKELFEFSHHMMETREEEQIRAHLAGCPACRGVVKEYQRVDAALGEWKAAEPSPWFDARVRATVAAAPPAKRGWLVLDHTRALALASLAVIVMAGALVVFRGRPQRPRPSTAAGEATAAAVQAPANTTSNPTATPPAHMESAEDEVTMYKNLRVLEDYDMLANFEVLSELPQGQGKVEN